MMPRKDRLGRIGAQEARKLRIALAISSVLHLLVFYAALRLIRPIEAETLGIQTGGMKFEILNEAQTETAAKSGIASGASKEESSSSREDRSDGNGANAQSSITAPGAGEAESISPGLIQAYLAQVDHKIRAHLRFPAHLRRAGVEGALTVSMVIGEDGALTTAPAISPEDAAPALKHLALEAVQSAAPFDAPPHNQPVRIALPIQFKIVRD